MRHLRQQIRDGLHNNLYYLSLHVSVAIPDICGALESDDGFADRGKYKDWFDKYVAYKYSGCLTAEDCYYFRCSLLHQGSSQNPQSTYERILFVEPGTTTSVFHCNVMSDALNVDVAIFCNDIVTGAEQWLSQIEGTPNYTKNYDRFMRRYPDSLAPYVVGIPVIS